MGICQEKISHFSSFFLEFVDNKIGGCKKMSQGKKTDERIRELRKKIGLRQVEFAQKIGISDSALSRIENGEGLTDQNILLICSPSRLVPGKTVSEAWLRTGEGEMFRAETGEDHLETELLGIYRQLWDENKTSVNKHAKFLLSEQDESGTVISPIREDTGKMPV
jgi:transcriptional regulator with XRE-family HTH domain